MIRRTPPTTKASSIAASAATHTSASRAAAMANLKLLLQEIEPNAQPDVLLAEDTKFGVMDSLYFSKIKTDKNGISCGRKVMLHSFDSIKDVAEMLKKSPHFFEGKTTVAYKPINDNYHFIILRKMNITKDNIDKYLVLL